MDEDVIAAEARNNQKDLNIEGSSEGGLRYGAIELSRLFGCGTVEGLDVELQDREGQEPPTLMQRTKLTQRSFVSPGT